MVAAVSGAVLAPWFQSVTPEQVAVVFLDGYQSKTGDAAIDDLLSRGGMASMMKTILLVMTATGLGGILEKGRYLEVILDALLRRIRRPAGLVTATVSASVGSNLLLSDQYLSIVLPGRLFRGAFPRMGLQPRMLSRSLEDGGTVTSPLVPWNSCGAFMATTLGVRTIEYLPFCFLNWSQPLFAILFAWLGWFQFKEPPQTTQQPAESPAS
jgi:NhaC family Na+:H+ antiporter